MPSIIGAGFDFIGLILGMQELGSAGDAVKIFKALGHFFQAFGLFFEIVFSVIELFISCPNISASAMGLLIGMIVGFSIAVALFSFFTGGLAMFLLSSIVNSILKLAMNAAFDIVKNDAGCE